MQDEKLKQGDTVMLKSSSTIMVIDSITPDKAHCKWFIHQNSTIGEAWFFLTSLKKVDPKDY